CRARTRPEPSRPARRRRGGGAARTSKGTSAEWGALVECSTSTKEDTMKGCAMNRTSPFMPPAFAMLLGCAPAMAKPNTLGEGRKRPDLAPLSIEYSISRRGDGHTVLLAGKMDVLPGRPASVEKSDADSPEREDLVLEARPTDDGRVLIQAHYKEVT